MSTRLKENLATISSTLMTDLFHVSTPPSGPGPRVRLLCNTELMDKAVIVKIKWDDPYKTLKTVSGT